MQYSIVIVDDHLLIAKAISGIIDHFKNYEVLYEVAHGKALMDKFQQKKNIPDIVLLDVSMPVMDGYETAQWLKETHPEVLVLALSMQDEEHVLIKMIKNGARGYLLKTIPPAELENALISLTTKGFYYPDWVTGKVIFNITSGNESRSTIKLTVRETEFLQYAATELTYKEIAEKMFCSPRTVESYRDNLFEKIGLKTRIGLVVYAIKHQIIQL